MLHPASGFRGVRVGAGQGASDRPELMTGRAMQQPRLHVSYWCTKGHETALVFAQLPDDQIPRTWDCRRCGSAASRAAANSAEASGSAASRDEAASAKANSAEASRPEARSGPGAAGGEGFKSHLEYVKERRSSQDAEDVLAGALKRLRARGALPDELLRDP